MTSATVTLPKITPPDAPAPERITPDGPAAPADAPDPAAGPDRIGKVSQIPGLPLTVILTIQVVLSVRLAVSNSAFSDEALYLWSGKLEWSHWLHGTPLPPFASYFSGAPVVYPPLAALADSIGGLVAARALSLCFLLAATILLHGFTRRLFDRRSANFAAALFAALGSAQFLGAFATYDAMAIFLLALATWLGVRAAGRAGVVSRAGLILAAAAALATADSAKYAATLFDPVVIVVIACFHWHALGRRAGALAGSLVTLGTAAIIGSALTIGGSPYWRGITSTTLTRATSNWPAFGIWYASIGWVGVVVILAVFGAIATSCATRSVPVRVLVYTLAAAGFLAPAEQARIHVFTSLFKHVAFGGWFAAPLAGYALTAFIRAIPANKSARARRLAIGIVALAGLAGVLLGADHFGNWSDVSPALPTLTSAVRTHPGELLVDDAPPFDYYLGSTEPWSQIVSIPNYPSDALAQGIAQRQYSVIMLSYALGGGGCGNDDPQQQSSQAQCLHNVDLKLLGDIISDGGYQLVAKIPYKTTSFASAFLIYVRQDHG